VVSLAAGGTVALLPASPAQAFPGGGAFTAIGTVSPPIQPTDALPTPRTVSLSVSLTGALGTVPGTASCSFSGPASESVGLGTGSVSGSCSGPGLTESCGLSYVRAGTEVVITGSCSGTYNGLVAGVAEMAPTDVNPTSVFTLTGVVGIGDTNGTPPPVGSLPGGPEGPSADCTSTAGVDTTPEGVHVRVLVDAESDGSYWVCVRAGTPTSGFGGKLVVTPPAPTGGGAGVPTTDANVAACRDTPGNQITGNHPIVAGSAPVEHKVDAYWGAAGLFVCLDVAGTNLRVVIPPPALPSPGSPGATWHPDPGTF
jgi:hypothetical protein